LADRVLTLSRVCTRVEALSNGLKRSQPDQEGKLKQLTREGELRTRSARRSLRRWSRIFCRWVQR
jgi:hypothetical protein